MHWLNDLLASHGPRPTDVINLHVDKSIIHQGVTCLQCTVITTPEFNLDRYSEVKRLTPNFERTCGDF